MISLKDLQREGQCSLLFSFLGESPGVEAETTAGATASITVVGFQNHQNHQIKNFSNLSYIRVSIMGFFGVFFCHLHATNNLPYICY